MIDIKVGDKVKSKDVIEIFGCSIPEDLIFTVDSLDEYLISLGFFDGSSYIKFKVSRELFYRHFKKYEEPKPEPKIETKVSPDWINWIMDNSEFEVSTIFDKCTLVSCKLPNGFIIVERSACVDPNNYDESIGTEICMRRIRDKVWELEGYMLQDKVHRHKQNGCSDSCCCCEDTEWFK